MNGRQTTLTDKATIKCKKCGHELPADAAFCDRCGAPVPSRKAEPETAAKPERRGAKKAVIIAAAVIIAVAAIIAIFAAASHTGNERTDKGETTEERLAKMSSRITPEMYEQLEFGMTYDDVVALFGEEGAEEYHDRRYIWPGEYFDADEGSDYYYSQPRVTLEFSDNKRLIEIKEYDVLDGREIYEAEAEGKTSSVVVNDEILSSMKNRMSYREIADILGAEGVLKESESDKSGYEMKNYEWKYVTEGEESSYERSLDIAFYNDKARRNNWDIWGAE